MARAMDGHDWRDPGFPGGYMPVQSLTPAERQKAEKAAKAREQRMKEDYAKSVTARREADAAVESSMDAVIAKASEIKSPMAERADKLGWVLRPDGGLVHKEELARRAAGRTPDENGVTPEEREQMDAWLEEDDDEEDPWR